MSLATPEKLAAKAEFYLMLSRCFLPPTTADSHAAFVDYLPAELAEVAPAAGYTLADELADYRSAAAALTDRTLLLQAYSALFLMPPREVQLHVAVYLDGAILGRSCDALEKFYAKHDLARSDDFHDLPDHLSTVLEFLALLNARAAETDGYARAELVSDALELNRNFLLSWVPVMRRQLAKAIAESTDRDSVTRGGPAFLALTSILQQALLHDAGKLSPELEQVLDPAAADATNRADPKEMARCSKCGADIAPAARIRRVRKVLEKEGIDTAHLDLCPKCRGVDLFPAGGRFPLV